ncbi:MAG: hypothetical protein ABIY51_06265 [Ferruginibacter sp.]
MKRASPYVNLAGLVLSMFICMLVDLWIHDKIKIFSGVNTSITKTALIPKNIKSSKNISFSEDAKNLCLILKPAVYDPKLF